MQVIVDHCLMTDTPIWTVGVVRDTIKHVSHELLTCWLQSFSTQVVVCDTQAWKMVLMRLCARYLLHVRRRRLAFDPVANFHLRNGASVWRLNWAADLSYSGLTASFGIMVNYRYVLEDVHNNNQMYLMDSKVPASTQVQQMADIQQTL